MEIKPELTVAAIERLLDFAILELARSTDSHLIHYWHDVIVRYSALYELLASEDVRYLDEEREIAVFWLVAGVGIAPTDIRLMRPTSRYCSMPAIALYTNRVEPFPDKFCQALRAMG